MIEREQFYINTLKPFFNIRLIADSNKGLKRTEEQKKYMISQRNKISPYKKGWKHSKESLEKISLAHKGKKLSKEHSLSFGCSNKGKKMSEETKQKISKSLIGKVVSNSTKEKLSNKKIGNLNPMFEKTKDKHHNYGKKWICNKKRESKKVIDLSSGIIYDSIKCAAKSLNIKYNTMYKYVLGYNLKINKFKYYE